MWLYDKIFIKNITNLNLNKNIIKLEQNKIQKDKNICKKPKTLLEFIRYGKKT